MSCLSDKNRSKKRGTVTRATNRGFWLKRWAYQAVRPNGTVALKCLVLGPLLPVPRGTAGLTGPIPKVPVRAVPYRGLPYRVGLVRYGFVTSPFCVVCSTWRSRLVVQYNVFRWNTKEEVMIPIIPAPVMNTSFVAGLARMAAEGREKACQSAVEKRTPSRRAVARLVRA